MPAVTTITSRDVLFETFGPRDWCVVFLRLLGIVHNEVGVLVGKVDCMILKGSLASSGFNGVSWIGK